MTRLAIGLVTIVASLLFGNQCGAQTRRVQIIAEDFKPVRVYQWSPNSSPRFHEDRLPPFTLLLTPSGRYDVVLQYRGDGQYLPPTSDFRLRVRVDSGSGPISISAPFNRWNSCNVRAVRLFKTIPCARLLK